MTKISRIPAPIDNKNVLEDFTSVFHNDEYVSRRSTKNTEHQYFVLEDCLCELTFCHGDNCFTLNVVHGEGLNRERCQYMLEELVKELFPEDYETDLFVEKITENKYAFYFKCEEETV